MTDCVFTTEKYKERRRNIFREFQDSKYLYLAHVIEQPIFRIPNLEYLQRNFVYLLDQQ